MAEDPKGHSGIGGGGANYSNVTLDASDPKSMKTLKAMAKQGVMPKEITGDRKDQSRMYEVIDELYPDYTGPMANYTVERYGSAIEINFHGADGTNPNDDGEFTTGGLGWTARLPGRFTASDSEIRGVTKLVIENQLPYLEHAVMYRIDGYSTGKMALKWGGSQAHFTDAQKKQINQELYAHVKKLTGRPVSEAAKEANEIQHWVKEPEGWRRRLA